MECLTYHQVRQAVLSWSTRSSRSHPRVVPYLQPSVHHLPVLRYVEPAIFEQLKQNADAMGFNHVASGPMVRSSYHADAQAQQVKNVSQAQQNMQPQAVNIA